MICDLEAKHIACNNFRVDSRYRLILLRTVPVICPHDALGNRFDFLNRQVGHNRHLLHMKVFGFYKPQAFIFKEECTMLSDSDGVPNAGSSDFTGGGSLSS